MGIFLILWILIVLIGAKKNASNTQTVFTKEFSLAIRGIAAAEIMLGHIGMETGSIILYPNRKAGILFVAIFFSLAGYGLVYSYEHKKNYLQHFITKKLKRILIPAYFVYVLFIITSAILNRNLLEIISIINPKKFFLLTNWYVWEILLLYLLFYIIYKINMKFKQQIILIVVVSIIFVAYLLKLENPWYGSTLSFWFGMWYYMNQEKVMNIIKKNYYGTCGMITIILCLAVGVFYFFDDRNVIGNIFARNIASVSFVLLVIVFAYKVELGNKLSFWIGKYSYEIYLFHLTFIIILKHMILISPILYAITVVCMTLVCSILYNKCERYILYLINKRI